MHALKVSTRGRYALRAAIDLAASWGKRPVLRRDLCERQGISPDYAAQILRTLRDAGIVETIRGPGGGYRLARDPSTTTVGDVIRAVEGRTAVVYCVTNRIDPPCLRSRDCTARGFWIDLSSEIDRCLNAVTLDALAGADGFRERGRSPSLHGKTHID